MLGNLDPSVAAKLAKICGLLGSDHDGERSAAAWQATRLLQAHGLTWTSVFAPAPPPPRPRVDPQTRATWLLSIGGLSLWEIEFLNGIVGRKRPLFPRQAAKLHEITERIERRTGGSAR